MGGPEKIRGGLANTLETWTETEIGGMAASETVSVNEIAIETENIVDDLRLEFTVHLHHPMDTLIIKLRITQTEKKASKYQSTNCMSHLSCRFLLPRISPTRSPRPASPTPSTAAPSEVTQIQKQPPALLQPDPELDLDVDTAAAEEAIRAARRARRQAILARYNGVVSANKSISPSPGSSSAVQPPQPVASVSDTLQPHSAVHTPGSTMDTSKARHDSISTFLARSHSHGFIYHIIQANETLHLHNRMTASLSLLRTKTMEMSV